MSSLARVNDLEFYSVAAQVIPVLVLALVIERRYFQRQPTESSGQSLFLLTVLLALVGGEFLALSALLEGPSPSALRQSVVMLALVWGFLGLLGGALRDRFAAASDALPAWLVSIVRIAWPFALLGVIALSVVFNSPDVIAAAVWVLVIGTLCAAHFAAAREEARAAKFRDHDREHRAADAEEDSVSPAVSGTGQNEANSAQPGDTQTPASS